MGFYINPPNEDKEDWLVRNGHQVSRGIAKAFDVNNDRTKVLVCLVQNPSFTAAGIAVTSSEKERFLGIPAYDPRPTWWYLVPLDAFGSDAGVMKDFQERFKDLSYWKGMD